VLLNLTKPVALALASQQVVAFAAGEYFSDIRMQSFDQAVISARGLLNKVKAQALTGSASRKLPRWLISEKPSVALVIDNSWVRIFTCRWHQSLRTHQEFRRYSEIEFERRFHSPLNQWTLVPDRLRPEGETLWCAYRSEHIVALGVLVSEAGLRIGSLLPSLFAEVALLQSPKGSVPTLYISGGDQSSNLCWLEDGRIRDVMVVSGDTTDELALVGTLLARLKRSPAEKVSIQRSLGTRIQVVQALLAGQVLRVSTATLECPIEALTTA
jgi:hypothetical protein